VRNQYLASFSQPPASYLRAWLLTLFLSLFQFITRYTKISNRQLHTSESCEEAAESRSSQLEQTRVNVWGAATVVVAAIEVSHTVSMYIQGLFNVHPHQQYIFEANKNIFFGVCLLAADVHLTPFSSSGTSIQSSV